MSSSDQFCLQAIVLIDSKSLNKRIMSSSDQFCLQAIVLIDSKSLRGEWVKHYFVPLTVHE